MAIDMLESTEGGVFTESRLGNKCFIDDENYSNLFGSKKRKREDKRAAENISARYAIPESKRRDCEWLNNKLIEANNHYEAVLSKNLKKKLAARETRPLTDAIASLKTALQQAKCAESVEIAEQEKSQQRVIEEINRASSEQDSTEQGGGAGMSKTTKYILFGVGGLVVVGGLIAILRK